MVLLRRLDYGFNGYQVPPMPRATRSARRRRCFKKGSEDNQICPFDLLAIVAGNLLLEKDGNPSSGDISANKDQSAVASDDVKKEWEDEGKLWKVEANDCENPARNFFVSELVSQVHAQISSPKENDKKLGLASPITNSDCMERVNVEKLVNSRRKDDMGTPNGNVKVAFSSYMECGDCKLKDQTMRLIKDEPHRPAKVLNNSESFMCSYDPVFCNKKPAPVSLHSSAKGPLHGNNIIPNTSYPVIQDNVNVVSRDDDDNSSGCTHTSTKKKFLRSAPRIGDRRIRKILASKYRKVAPKLKDAILSKIDGDWRSAYCNRKNSYKYQRSEKLYPLKKRKHFGGYNSLSYSDGGISSESFLDSPQQDNSGDASGPFQKMHRATGPSVVGQKTPFQPRDSHVKLRIKSFRVPELFIEIPESGTIGSLKRAVMEAVTAVLGGGLRVGVLLQGKKVRDDNKTLLQTGISHHNQLDALGFSLEPNHPQPSASLHPGDSLFLLPCEAPQPLSSRYPPTTVAVHPGRCATSAEPHAANSGDLVISNHDSAPSPTDTSVDNSTTNSKALVTVSAMNVEAHTVAPAPLKYKRSEIAQRRIRRPFSVAEVEALVLAVEKLGTGRWRDVKLRAFDNAKHRTYVDLKDKWKTLVHTARISPQQRRGEPVPQELLDRVLTAHAYWSQQQAKHQLKHQLPETCLLL